MKWITPTGKKSTTGKKNIRTNMKKGYQFKGYESGDPFKKNIKQKKQTSLKQPKKQEKTISISESFTIKEML